MVDGMNVRDAGMTMSEIASRIAATKRSTDAVLPTIGLPTAANSDVPVTPSEWAKANAEGLWTYEKYKTLSAILDAAFAHAATGKGKERHARDLPFDKQPMLETTRLVGPGFPLGQAIKKAGEAAGMIERGELDAAEAECLGAINYLAGAVAWMREQQKQTDMDIAAAA